MNHDLGGLAAIVTGSGQGIGRAIAIELARAGAAIAVADLDVEKAKDTSDAIHALGSNAVALRVDVADAKSVERCVAEAIARFTRIDILVNNAGVFQREPAFELSAGDFNRCLDINVTGMWRIVRVLAPHFRAHKSGRIVNIASVGGRQGVDFAPAYCASKAAVINLTQSLALALGPDNITVNTVCPGAVATAMQEKIKEALNMRQDASRNRQRTTPLAGPLMAEDIGHAVVFFASDRAKNITGQALNVDCGYLMS